MASILDVSTSAEGKVLGDVDQAAAEIAGWVSPNPGEVGPMTRAMLLCNVVLAAEISAAEIGAVEIGAVEIGAVS